MATYQDLIEEVLDELLLQRSRGEEAVKIGSEQFGDEVAGGIRKCGGIKGAKLPTYPRGER